MTAERAKGGKTQPYNYRFTKRTKITKNSDSVKYTAECSGTSPLRLSPRDFTAFQTADSDTPHKTAQFPCAKARLCKLFRLNMFSKQTPSPIFHESSATPSRPNWREESAKQFWKQLLKTKLKVSLRDCLTIYKISNYFHISCPNDDQNFPFYLF